MDTENCNAGILIENLMLNKNFQPGHKVLTQSLGVLEAMVLQQHIYRQSTKGGSYTNIRKKIEKDYRLSVRIQRPIEQKLISIGFLIVESKEGSSYNYYTVNTDLINEFIKCSYQKRLDIVDKAYASISSDSKEGGSNKTLCGGSNKTSSLILDRTDIDTDNKLSVKGFDKPLSDGNKKSRLMDKGNLPDNYVVPKNSLVDRTSSTVQQNKRAAIAIPERTRQCIEYWNKFPELVEHRINPENPTSLIVDVVKLIGAFFAGNFLSVVDVPKWFKYHDWFDVKPNVDEFCDLVDIFVERLGNPETYPKKNGKKYDLPTFLKGNAFVGKDRDPIPSMMLNYCFGPCQLIMVDQFPETTNHIKAIWLKYVGKYKPTPEAEKAFVVASKLCHMRYDEKRVEEESWYPAQNDYRPEGIARQILFHQSEFFKEKRIQPSLMANSWFGSLIRKYDYDRKTGSMVL